VEDEPLMAKKIERILGDSGYQVAAIASTAGQAVLQAGEMSPDLVLMDIRLRHDSSGREAAREIRVRFDIPVVFIATYADMETVTAAKAADPYGYVLKPINEKELLASISVALHKHRREKGLKKNIEDRYVFLVENITEGMVILDKDDVIDLVNEKFLKTSGYVPWEVIGHRGNEFFVKASDEEAKENSSREMPQKRICRGTLKLKNGTSQVTISSEPFFDEAGGLSGQLAIITDITDRLRFEEELSRTRKELRNLSQHLQTVREEESKRIAREIHDELGQALTALKMDISWLAGHHAQDFKDPEQFLRKTRSMSELIDGTIKLVQKICAELRPGLLDDLGLVPAIEWQLQDFQNRTKIKVSARIDCSDLQLTSDQTTAVFRVFQEALTNVARHARATQVKVRLQKKDDLLILRISDNGRGIDEAEILAPESLGFMGMRERLRPFQGKLEIFGARHKGTSVEITVPLDQTNADD
jgi:two-component system sensor histidine kinase UhpB